MKAVLLKEKFSKVLYSDIYLAVLALFIFLGWLFQLEKIALVLVFVFGTVIFILNDDVLPAFALLLFTPLVFPKDTDPSGYFVLLYAAIPLVGAIIYHIVKYRRKFKTGQMFYPQLAVSVALILGGCTCISANDYMRVIGFTLFLGAGILLLYSLMNQYVIEDKNRDTGVYMARMLMYMGIIISLQMVVFYIRADVPPYALFNSSIALGWAISNNTATVLLLTVPMSFYLMTKYEKGWIYGLVGVIQYIAIIMTFSRGGILFAAATAPAVVIFTILKAKNRKNAIIGASILASAVIIVFFCTFKSSCLFLKNFLSQGTGVSGRDLLYAEAWEQFKNYPIFGAGLGFNGDYFTLNNISFYWFHSTFFQIIGCLGLLGLAAYVYCYYTRFKIVFKCIKKNTYNIFVFLSFLGFELYSMMDTGTFIPMPSMMMVFLMTLTVEITNRRTLETEAENLKLNTEA